MCPCLCVCLFAGLLSHKSIFIKLGGREGHDPVKSPSGFGADPDPGVDPGIIFKKKILNTAK